MSTALMTRQPAPQRQGDVWNYISPSRLGLWIRCPLAFKFRYVDGIRSPTNANMFQPCDVDADGDSDAVDSGLGGCGVVFLNCP